MNKKTFYSAFVATIPVMLGYLAIGIAFGLMLESIGYNFLWAGFMSTIIYAGSMQYIAVDLLNRGAPLYEVAVMTLIVQSRHIVYGLSLLNKFNGMGLRKKYMIFSLTDETYALLSSTNVPLGVDKNSYYFTIAFLNQIYWITGGIIGSLAGSLITFDITGIDFAMTALFIVIALEQWLTSPTHIPALMGFAAATISLLIFKADNMLIPSMIIIITLLLIFNEKIDTRFEGAAKGDKIENPV